MLRLRFSLPVLGVLALVFGVAAVQAHAQAIPAATQNLVEVGAGVSWGTADEWPPQTATDSSMGISLFGALEVYRHIGPEADVHLMSIKAPHTLVENSFLLGPRYTLHYGRIEPYGKFLFGLTHTSITKPNFVPNTPGTFFAISFGGGIDYRLTPRIVVRGDFEYQDWLSFKPNGLDPTVTTVGVAYRFR